MKLWAKILITVLVLALLGGGIFGIVKLADEGKLDSKKVSDLTFSIGGLDGAGNYKNTDASIYTKNAFECQGLECTLDFDAEIWYQIYFYDQNNEFVHTTGKLTGAFVKDSVPLFAKYARIVITPNDDNKVSMLEVLKYAKQLNVKIYREQGFKNYTEDLFEVGTEHASVNNTTGVVDTSNANQTTCVSKNINVSSYKEGLIFRFGAGTDLHSTAIYFYNKNHEYLGYNSVEAASVQIFISSEGVDYYAIDFASVPLIGGSTATDIAYVVLCCSPTNPLQVYCR